MSNKHTIRSGDYSSNMQGEIFTINQTNNNGVSFSEVKDIAMMVFKSNFYDLGTTVNEIVDTRAEKFINDYLDKLRLKNPEILNNTVEPDVRYMIYESQKEYSRRGDKIPYELLMDTLVERTSISDGSIVEITLNEALGIIPKLLPDHIKFITFLYIWLELANRTNFSAEKILSISRQIIPDLDFIKKETISQHLQYLGCSYIITATTKFAELPFNRKFSDFVNFSGNENMDYMMAVINTWDRSLLRASILTNIGVVIALLNIQLNTNIRFNIESFLQ